MTTMTLHTLKSITNRAPQDGTPVPGFQQLQNSGSEIVVRSLVADMLIIVYRNGYVACQRGVNHTVFRLHDCCGYFYQSVQNDSFICLPESMFADEDWYFRLFLEADDRFYKNQEQKQRKKSIRCFDQMAESITAFSDSRAEGLRTVLEQEDLQRFWENFALLTKKQQLAVRLYCIEGLSLEDCAAIYGASSRAVSQALHRAIRILLSSYGISTDKVALSYHRSRRDGNEEA